MNTSVPELMIVRVLTPAGPFSAGDVISVAFADATVGRLRPHAVGTEPSASARDVAALVPETMTARVTAGSEPYQTGDVVMLSFVDPRFARIHSAGERTVERLPPVEIVPVASRVVDVPQLVVTVSAPAMVATDDPLVATAHGVHVRLDWSPERARRFVRVVDKLFTVDRLGWYRHVLAMRLLVPDRIDCGNEERNREPMRHLQSLRAATIETLGRPLLAAFMPTFGITREWLDSVDSPAVARALAGLRETLAPLAADEHRLREVQLDAGASFGVVRRVELAGSAGASADALLPVLVPPYSANVALSACLRAYRASLIDVFSQTAHCAEEVRLGQMSEPNCVLDDRLWQLVGAVGTSVDALVTPVAS